MQHRVSGSHVIQLLATMGAASIGQILSELQSRYAILASQEDIAHELDKLAHEDFVEAKDGLWALRHEQVDLKS